MIYLDHNATTPLAAQAMDAMSTYLCERWGNPSSPHRFGKEAKLAVEMARERIARCVGCDPCELVFTSGGTESDNLALRGAARALRNRGKHIVTSAVEHHAVLNTCRALEEDGYRVTCLPVNSDGIVEPEWVAKSLTAETILVSIMHANNETGVIQPLKEIAGIAKKRDVLFHTDAVQTVGKIPIQLDETGANLVSFSGHKIYGPKGIGVLYVKKGTPLAPILTGGSHERGLRAGTENVAAIVGLSEAVVLACGSLESEAKRIEVLRDDLERRIIATVAGVRVNGGVSQRVPNTSNLSFQSVDGEAIVLGLDLLGICVSTGSACSTGAPEPSHVLLAMGLSAREAQGSIRLSLGKDTTVQDIDFVARSISDVLTRLRCISSV